MIRKKVLSGMLLFVIIISNILPTVNAIQNDFIRIDSEENVENIAVENNEIKATTIVENTITENTITENTTTENTTTENTTTENTTIENTTTENTTTENTTTENITTENITTENTTAENTTVENIVKENTEINYFETILNEIIDLKNNNNSIEEMFTKNGFWIDEESREYFLNMLNSVMKDMYYIDENGYLQETKNNTKNNLNDDILIYREKIEKIINNQESSIILSISDSDKRYKDSNNKIVDINFKDDYTIIFDNNNPNSKVSHIILLNGKYYNNESNIDISILINNLLESLSFEEYTQELEDSDLKDEKNSNIEKIEKSNVFDDRVTKQDFEIILAGLIDDQINLDNYKEILNKISSVDKGIWISPDSREQFVNFINKYTIYTYYVDNSGFLNCNNIMKDNPYLDLLERDETEIDKEIKSFLNSDKLLIIGIKDKYYFKDNESINSILLDDIYKVTFSNKNKKIILLNNNFYDTEDYDLALSDYFIKSINNIEEKVLIGELKHKSENPLARSDTSKPGIMLSAQNVYAGPDASNYAKVGSVSSGEKVYLLGQSAGWYHIQYIVTSNSTQKSGFVPVSTVNNNGHSIHEEIMTGGQRYTTTSVNVQSCDDFDISTKIGSIYSGEGITLLYNYTYSDSEKSYNVSYVEFSTSSGTKRGYIKSNQITAPAYNTSVARVIDINSAYSGPDKSYVKLGGVYYNEYVTILAKNEGEDYVFVEYNTTSGRKRGFVLYSKLSNCNVASNYQSIPNNQGLKKATQELIVYGGPNSNNANIGKIFAQEIITSYGSEKGYTYIEYSTVNGAKRGYVDSSYLENASTPSIPLLTEYANFTSRYIWNEWIRTIFKVL